MGFEVWKNCIFIHVISVYTHKNHTKYLSYIIFFLPFSFLAFCFSIVSRLFSYYLNNKKKGGGVSWHSSGSANCRHYMYKDCVISILSMAILSLTTKLWVIFSVFSNNRSSINVICSHVIGADANDVMTYIVRLYEYIKDSKRTKSGRFLIHSVLQVAINRVQVLFFQS